VNTFETPSTDAPASHRREDEWTGERHVHEPHRVGLPPMGSYVRELWRRREFAQELSRTNLRAQHFNTLFGQLWLVINPVLLGIVYFVLVDILRGGSRGADFFAHLLAGLFAYYLVNHAVTNAARSVVSGGRLILNTAFPRTLLPIASVITAFKRFLPTFIVYVPIHLATGLPVGWHLLWVIPIVGLLLVLASGLAMLVAAAQVYFRDLKNFLPYALRLWLYVSPILYFAHEVPERYRAVLAINPIAPLLTAWSDVLNLGRAPGANEMLLGAAWAFAILIGGALYFISREREFAVRL